MVTVVTLNDRRKATSAVTCEDALYSQQNNESAVQCVFYSRGTWAHCVRLTASAEGPDEVQQSKPYALNIGTPIKQLMALEGGMCVVILDEKGRGYLWWPFGRGLPTLPDEYNITLEAAKRSHRAVQLPIPPNCPATKIVAADHNLFALQHELRLYTSIWRTDQHHGVFLEDVKENGVTISPHNHWIAVVTRRACIDTVSIYSVDPSPVGTPIVQQLPQLKLISRWNVPKTSKVHWSGDVQSVRWVPKRGKDTYIALLDSRFTYCSLVYRVADGKLIRIIVRQQDTETLALSDPSITSSDISNDEDLGLGAKKIDWGYCENRAPTLAIADYSNKVRLYSEANLFATPFTILQHNASVFNSTSENILYYKEIYSDKSAHGIHSSKAPTEYEAAVIAPQTVFNIATSSSALEATTLTGILHLEFSENGEYLATVSSIAPRHVWIWKLGEAEGATPRLVALLENLNPISCLAWSPTNVLAFTSDSGSVYFWRDDGAMAVLIPEASAAMGEGAGARARRIKWCANGNAILLLSPSRRIANGIDSTPSCFCIGFMNET